MEQKRYIFKKAYSNNAGTIPKGTQVDLLNGVFYVNGGLCDNYSQQLFNYLLNTMKLKEEYFKEVVIPYNKI